jgi:predicted RNA binding protein YcfA (HicA-like mRNA interferase family)
LHFYGPAFGIFMYDDCVVDIARDLARRSPIMAPPDQWVRTLLRAGFAALFLHEQYHHKTESLGIRLHIAQQTPCYVRYFRDVYRATWLTDDCIEEGLANANSYRRVRDKPYRTMLDRIQPFLDYHLRDAFDAAGPGYALGWGYRSDKMFGAAEAALFSQVQEGLLTPTRPNTADFGVAANLNDPFFNLKQNIWAVVQQGLPLLPTKVGTTAPFPRNKVEKLVKANGFTYQKGRGHGSHSVYTRPGSPIIVLPDSRDLSPVVLRTTAKTLGISMHELRVAANAA